MNIDLRHHPYKPDPARIEALQDRLRSQITVRDKEVGLVRVSGTDDCSDLLRALEQQTFDSAFGDRVPHTPDFMLNEYGPWDDQSTFFSVIDANSGEALGGLRIITGPRGKTVSDLSRTGVLDLRECERQYRFEESPTWDIGTVAIVNSLRGTLRGQEVATLLYHMLYEQAINDEIVQWTSIIDAQVLRRYHRLGIPFARLQQLEDLNYLGSSATACHLFVEHIRTSMETKALGQGQRIRSTINVILNGRAAEPQEIDLRSSQISETSIR